MLPFYLLALIALLVGTAAIYMAMIKVFPVEWLYYQYFMGRAIVWTILIFSTIWAVLTTLQTSAFPLGIIAPLLLMGLALVLSYKMRQENVFQAVDFPTLADHPLDLPLPDTAQIAVIEYEGETKAYPLDYVVHHHVVNDRFGDRIVSLTYCAMCRSIIPFDVTDIGPLFVGSFKNANMIVADRKTKTWFQQASFDSIIGKLHPHTLTMIPYQIITWADLKTLNPLPRVAKITQEDLRQFELPIPGLWKKIMASEATPGLSSKEVDKSFPARTHVIGITDPLFQTETVYIKDELLKQGVVHNQALNVYLVAKSNTVNAFKGKLADSLLNLTLNADNTLSDAVTGTTWDIRGKRISGEIQLDLAPITLSDEYWFSWKKYHPASELIRL